MAEIGRLALRVEGEFWNAYWCPHQDSMKEAIIVAAIRTSCVSTNPVRKKAFMELAQAAFGDVVEELTGQSPTWSDPRPGPESERSGSA